MTSYRPEDESNSGLWIVNQDGANMNPSTMHSYKTLPFSGHQISPKDGYKTIHVSDSGYASPLTESTVKGLPHNTYYVGGTQSAGSKYPVSSGTYPGARSSITVTRLPDNQNYSRPQEYENYYQPSHLEENYAGEISESLPFYPVQSKRVALQKKSPGSYQSVIVTRVSSSGGDNVDIRQPRSDVPFPNERHIDIQVQQLPPSAPSRLVYSSQPPALGVVRSKPLNHALSPRLEEEAMFSPTKQQMAPHLQAKMFPSGLLQDPRPYQLKPIMDQTSTYRGLQGTPVGISVNVQDSKKEAEVDALTDLLMQNMQVAGDPNFFGMCAGCGRSIMGENTGCTALDQLFHIDCFRCISCNIPLRGHPFYAMEGKPYCETCYVSTLEKCSTCSKPITDRMLRATGKPYHPNCFNCVVCGRNLDGVAFTVDATSQIHCIDDFHRKFAPRCSVCCQPIMPLPGKEETIRIVALDRSFHIDCYRCEECHTQLSSESEGRGCYPLDDHILCKSCNAKRIQAMTSKMITEL